MPIDKTCEQCGTNFKVRPRNATQRFCSKTCVTAHEGIYGRIAAQVPLTEFACKECGNAFFHAPANVRAYFKKHGKNPLYCSMPCSDLGRRKDTMDRQRFTCAQCGKEQSRRRKPGGRVYAEQIYCDRACKAAHHKNVAMTRFNGGDIKRHVKRHGYVHIALPALLSNTGRKREMLEHRYVMSKHLGRDLLPEETVHHIDGNRQNNDIGNLELFSSRHGPGQRVNDKVDFAIELMRLYPEFFQARGVKFDLANVTHVSDSPASREAHRAQACP